MVIILASIQGVEASSQKYFAVLVWPVQPHLGPGFSGDVGIHSVTPLDSGCSCKHSPPLKVLCKMTSEALRKGGAFSQACKGFAEVTFLASHRTSSAEARAGSSFWWTTRLLQHRDQPFIRYYSSPSTAHLATSVAKRDGFINHLLSFPQPRFTCRINLSCTLQLQGSQPALEQALSESSHQKRQVLALLPAVVGSARLQPAAN